MKLSTLPDIYIDAELDAQYNKKTFSLGFYDFKNTLSRLVNVNSPISFISGRKGTGKSTYIYKINKNYNSSIIDLKNLPYKSIQKIAKKDTDSADTSYQSVWIFLLINHVIFDIEDNYIESGLATIHELRTLSNELGLGEDFNYSISVAARSSFKISLPKVFEYSSENTTSNDYSIRDLSNFFISRFKKIIFKEDYFLLIDGVDDILSTPSHRTEMLGDLFITIRDFNLIALNLDSKFKAIMAVRTDIWNLVNGPDMNKLNQTSQVVLEWFNGDNNLELARLLNKRLQINSDIQDILDSDVNDPLIFWNSIFPNNINMHGRSIESWNYFLEYSLYRPRDVIQLIKQAKETYPDREKLTYSEFRSLINDFSKDFFFNEMKNELAGFVKEKILGDLPNALQSLGRESFKYPDFLKSFFDIDASYTDTEIQQLLLFLFNNGYIGQRSSEQNRYAFKHKNSRQQLSLKNSLVIHRGLYAAVAINN